MSFGSYLDAIKLLEEKIETQRKNCCTWTDETRAYFTGLKEAIDLLKDAWDKERIEFEKAHAPSGGPFGSEGEYL